MMVALAVAASVSCAGAGPVVAQSYPSKPIKLVVPFPAGGANDSVARLVTQGLASELGQPVIVENQAGAGGNIATRQVANAAPDGHTLLMVVPTNTFGTAPVLHELDYDPAKVFALVGLLAADKQIMVVGPSVSAPTVQELIQYARSNPGKLNYGSAPGIAPHFLMEMLKRKTGTDIVHVPYRGGAPMITDLLGSQIQMTINGKSVLMPHIAQGKLRPVAVTNSARWPEFNDVPTLLEAGYLDFAYETQFGVVAPAATPEPVLDALSRAIAKTLSAETVRASFAKLGLEPRIASRQEFAKLVADEGPRWADIARITGIKLK
jgi:tripartite-type tricarboxylate transporter receptor subunit TctC